jgi:hypothetical protein
MQTMKAGSGMVMVVSLSAMPIISAGTGSCCAQRQEEMLSRSGDSFDGVCACWSR